MLGAIVDRAVDMLPLLREILAEHKAASANTRPDDPVFVTATGRPRSRHNLRQDVVEAVVHRAEGLQAERGAQPLPHGVSPHKLRHTFASVLITIGKDPISVMGQLGHTDPAFTLRVCAHMLRRSPEERERLRALVEEGTSPIEKTQKRHTAAPTDPDAGVQQHPQATKNPRDSGGFPKSGRPDLNRGPHRPERCALPGCATPRRGFDSSWALRRRP